MSKSARPLVLLSVHVSRFDMLTPKDALGTVLLDHFRSQNGATASRLLHLDGYQRHKGKNGRYLQMLERLGGFNWQNTSDP